MDKWRLSSVLNLVILGDLWLMICPSWVAVAESMDAPQNCMGLPMNAFFCVSSSWQSNLSECSSTFLFPSSIQMHGI